MQAESSARFGSMERDWASLGGGLLRDIFIRLPNDVDAVHFRRVCPGWRAAAGGAGTPVPRPWFIFNSADGDGTAGHAFVQPVDRGRHTRVSSVHVGSAALLTGGGVRVRGASRGWLAVTQGERLLLRDPISHAEIPLPAAFDGYQLFDVFLSDDPLAAPGSWTAFAFFEWGVDACAQQLPGPEEVLAFCRPGDAEWARVDPVADHGQQTRRLYRGLEFFGGRPYVLLARPPRLAVCDVEARRLVVSNVHIYPPPGWKWNWQECLVECGGDLLVVQVARRDDEHRWPCPSYCPGGHHFVRRSTHYLATAFKIQFGADGGGMPSGVALATSTGDYAVFVAPQGHAFALPASGFPAVRAGCVYFFAANDHTKSVRGMVVIDLEAGPSRRRDKFVRELPLAGNWRILSWFCPRPASDTTTPARRRWCAIKAIRKAFPFFNY